MNNLYSSVIKKSFINSLIVFSIFLLLSGGILFLQSTKFASSLWVLLSFGYSEWAKYLLNILGSLRIWAFAAGIFFSIHFYVFSPTNHPKKILIHAAAGFVIGFVYTFLLVFVIGIIIFIPLGTLSIYIPEVIKYATLEFAWLVAAYIIFILIAIDAPRILLTAIKYGNWYFKLVGLLAAALLGVQILKAVIGLLMIILDNTLWKTITFILSLGISLLISIILNTILIRRKVLVNVVFAIVIVFIASVITGSIFYGVFHWGELPSMVIASILGPIVYSLAADRIMHYGINAFSSIYGITGGIVIGLLIDNYTHLRIINESWINVFCGSIITIGIGVGFGLLYGSMLGNLLINRMKIGLSTGLCIIGGFFLGIIIGMVSGGFITI